MKQLQQAVADSFSNILTSGVIEAAIDKRLTETINSIIDSELKSYSDFGKKLGEHMKTALQVDFSNLGLPGYNDLILKVIRRQVDAGINNVLAAQVEKQMTELLQPAPAEIKLSKLIEDFIKAKTKDGCSCDEQSHISLFIDKSEGLTSGYWNVYMDPISGKSKYSCEVQFGATDSGKIYSLKIDSGDPSKTLFVGPIYGFELDLFQMYAAGTKLILDGESAEDFDTRYPDYDD